MAIWREMKSHKQYHYQNSLFNLTFEKFQEYLTTLQLKRLMTQKLVSRGSHVWDVLTDQEIISRTKFR